MLAFLAGKWQSLVFRLLFYFVLAILVLAMVLAFSFSQRMRPHIQQQVLPNVERYLDYLVSDIGVPPDLGVARQLARDLPFEIRIEGQGIDWASSDDIRPISSYRFKSAPPPYQSIYYSHGRHRERVLLERSGVQYLFVVEDGFRQGSERRHWLLFVGLGAILLLLYIGIRRLLRPIAALSEQVRKIGEGDLEQSLDTTKRGELGMLAEGVNQMSAQIRAMLENKSGLLLAISHELRSPLTRMRVNLELLEENELRNQLIDDTREMEALLAAILESEKLTSGYAPLAKQQVAMQRLVEEVVRLHPGRDRIRCQLQPVTAEIDELRVKLLLKNLLDNALQYSRDESQEVMVKLEPGTDTVLIEVIDRGIGIPANELERLGEAFYRPDTARSRSSGGYGLGLYLCRLICHAHGGFLRLQSTPGEGTSATVCLPLDNS